MSSRSTARLARRLAAGLAISGAVLIAAGCGDSSPDESSSNAQPDATPTDVVATAPDSKVDGAWNVLGYGLTVVVEDGLLTDMYVPTGEWCADVDIEIPPEAASEIELVDADSAVFDGYYPFERTELPEACKDTTAPVPAHAPIEAFIAIMDEHYPFFDERDIDWASEKQKLQTAATSVTSTDEAGSVIANFIAAMNDGHMSIDAEVTEPAPGRPSGLTPAEALTESRRMSAYLPKTASLADEALEYGQLLPDVGYLKISRMAEFGDAGVADLARHLDEALTELEGNDKLIMDLRGNGGGGDEFSLEVVSRFTDEPADLYTKEAYGVPSTRTTVSVEPSTGVRFDGEVVVLVNGGSASAAETLGIGMHTVGATTIGSPTEGILSDINNMALPGGIALNISNEIYSDLDGQTYEVRGVPLSVETKDADTFAAALTPEELAALPDVPELSQEELAEANSGVGGLRAILGERCLAEVGGVASTPDAAADICDRIFARTVEVHGEDVAEKLTSGELTEDIVLPIFEEVLAEAGL